MCDPQAQQNSLSSKSFTLLHSPQPPTPHRAQAGISSSLSYILKLTSKEKESESSLLAPAENPEK